MPSTPIHVCSLATETRRRAAVRKRLDSYEPVTFVDAIDGRGWSDEEANAHLSSELLAVRERSRARGAFWFATGAVACALTHRDRLLPNATETGAVMCEDDALIEAEFLPHLADGSAAEASAFCRGPVLLSYRSRHPIGAYREPIASFGRYTIHRLDPEHIASSAAYLISRRAAEGIMRIQRPLRATADDWNRMIKVGAFEVLYAVHPMPARTGDFPASINYDRTPRGRLVEAVKHIVLLRRFRLAMLRLRGRYHERISRWL